VNPQNQTLTIVSTVQAAPEPFLPGTDAGKVNFVPPDSTWSRWSSAEKGGVIAAAVLAGLLLITVCAYICVTGQSRKKIKDTEKGEKNGEKQRIRFSFRGIPGVLSSAKHTTSKAVDKKGKTTMELGKLQGGTGSVKDMKDSGP